MTLSITTPFRRGIQRYPWSDWMPTAFTVNDTVGGVAVERGFVYADGSPVASAFGACGNTIQGANDFSMNIPTGGPFFAAVQPVGNPGARVTASTPIVVGDVTVAVGQSCMGQWLTHTGAYTPDPRTALLYNGVFQAPSGDGITAYLNALVTLTGVPQIFVMCAVGATALTRDGWMNYAGAGSAQNGFWMARNETGSALCWDNLVAQMAIINGGCVRLLWDQGESDCLNVRPETYYRALRKFWADFKSPLCAYAADVSMGIIETGDYQPTFPAGNKSMPIILAQRKFAADFPSEVYIAAQRYDLPRNPAPDNIHPTPASCAALASQRVAPLIARRDYFV